MYSLCLQSCRQKTYLHCLNSYNWPFEGKHNADVVLSENEFDNLLQCDRMSESSSEMMYRLPADLMAIYISYIC